MEKVILLIEDDEDIRESAAELLRLDGFQVIEAASGEQALPIVGRQHPDLIICDIVMAGMDGFEVLRHLKKRIQTRQIPFIFSTAKSEKGDRYKALQLGVAHYLTKPFDEEELLRCIAACLVS